MINVTWESVVDLTLNVTTYRLKVPGGWLVAVNAGCMFIADPTYAWVGTASTVPVTPPPVVVVPPVVVPVTPPPVVVPVTPPPVVVVPPVASNLYYIYKDGLQNAWRDYTWATETHVTGDEGVGSNVIKATIGAWAGISFNNLNDAAVPSQNYLGVQFDIKGDGQEAINLVLTSDQSDVAMKSIPLTTAWQTVKVLWADLALAPFATFTNVVFRNPTGTAMVYPVEVNNVALIVNPNPPVTVPVPTVLDTTPALANTAGTKWLHVAGNKILDEAGVQWMGRGVNVFDTRLDGSGIATDPVTATAEVIRRIDFAVANGADYFRLLLQALDSSGKVTAAAEPQNNPAYLTALKNIVNHIGTIPGARVEITVDIDQSLSPAIGGQPTEATAAVLTQLVYSFANCSHVLFGCCNEPAGNATAALPALVTVFSHMVAAVRAAEAKVNSPHPHLVVVQGVNNYAREVLYYTTNPVVDPAGAVVYESHIYDTNGDLWWGEYIKAAALIPVMCGEFGPVAGTMTLAECATWQAELETLKTPYSGWALDQAAAPAMLVDHTNGGNGVGMVLELNAWGQQFFAALKKAKGL